MGKWSEITLLIGVITLLSPPFITGSWGVSLGVITPLNFGILVVLEAWRPWGVQGKGITREPSGFLGKIGGITTPPHQESYKNTLVKV